MYVDQIPEKPLTTTLVKIKYDCCGTAHILKWRDADKNFQKNCGKHICRPCGLRVNNPGSRPEVKAKIKKTVDERYGGVLPVNSEENIAARTEAMFGTEEAKQAIVSKRKKTSQERYGADHFMQTDEGKTKLKEAFNEKYGVDYPLQNEDVKERMRQTCQDRYGVDNPLQLPEVRVKAAQTTLAKYGVEHYNQLPEMKEYLRQNCTEWLAESYANPWAKGITRPEEWNQKQRETVTALMAAGEWRAGYPRSKKGFCFPKKSVKEKVYFRSSYEAIYCYYLEQHPDVVSFGVEQFRIPYEFEGKQRYYVPDFIVSWKDGRLSIKDLKATFLKEDDQQHAGSIFAACNDMDYEVLFCDYIESLNISFNHLKEIGFVKAEA